MIKIIVLSFPAVYQFFRITRWRQYLGTKICILGVLIFKY